MFSKKRTCLLPVRVISVISKYELNLNLHVLLSQPQKILTLRAITLQNSCNITGSVISLADDLHHMSMKKLTSHGQSIGDVFGWSITHSLLSSDVYSNLTKLWCQDEDGKVIAALGNASALEYLNITPGGVVMLSTLETIHQNAPNLKYLRIDTLRLDGSDIDYQVSPAPLITTFETEQMEQTFINAEHDLFNYIDRQVDG